MKRYVQASWQLKEFSCLSLKFEGQMSLSSHIPSYTLHWSLLVPSVTRQTAAEWVWKVWFIVWSRHGVCVWSPLLSWVLFNIDHRLLEGRRADGLVQISGQIPVQSAEADMNCSHSLCTWQCVPPQNPREADQRLLSRLTQAKLQTSACWVWKWCMCWIARNNTLFSASHVLSMCYSPVQAFTPLTF